jgi:hypothetical protein
MKKIRCDSLTYQIRQRIDKLPSKTILRSDVDDLGDYRQVSRALLSLIKRGIVVRIGYGLYAKARQSSISKKPVIDGGFQEIACEALDRLEVDWEIGQAYQDYNERRSTQVPVHAIVKLKSRFRRTISWGGMKLRYE